MAALGYVINTRSIFFKFDIHQHMLISAMSNLKKFPRITSLDPHFRGRPGRERKGTVGREAG